MSDIEYLELLRTGQRNVYQHLMRYLRTQEDLYFETGKDDESIDTMIRKYRTELCNYNRKIREEMERE